MKEWKETHHHIFELCLLHNVTMLSLISLEYDTLTVVTLIYFTPAVYTNVPPHFPCERVTVSYSRASPPS